MTPEVLRACLVKDFGHCSNHESMNDSFLLGGSFGLSYLMDSVVYAFLDSHPLSSCHFESCLGILRDFITSLQFRLNTYSKVSGARPASILIV